MNVDIKHEANSNNEISQILVALLNKSFLAPYLKLDLTDISFNGTDLYICDNINGRVKVDSIDIKPIKVLELTRQIANLMGKNFNYTHPILEVSFDKYRLSAVYSSIAKSKLNSVITFSLRIRYEQLRIKKNDTSLCSISVYHLLELLIASNYSILISGKTGSGKTELQKYLVSLIDKKEKIILIEDSYESCLKELLPSHDITTWVILDEYNTSRLVKVALRSHPDWLIVAESRGEEVLEMIEAVSTGHPLITTLHANNAVQIFDRIYNMGQSKIKINKSDFSLMLASFFNIGIHMQAVKTSQGIVRQIMQIVEYYVEDNKIIYNVIYERVNGQEIYHNLSKELAIRLKIDEMWY